MGETKNSGGSRVWKKLDTAIYAVGDLKIVYFRIMVNGKRETMKSPIQGAAAIGANGKPTPEVKKACLNWRYQLMNRDYYEQQDRKLKVPSFAKLLELYEDAATSEQIKNGSPGTRTIETAVKYFRYLVDGCGFKWTQPMTMLKTGDIDKYVVGLIKAGKAPITALSYAASCQSVTPKWALEYYAREGYDVRPYQMPIFKNRKPPRYERPSKATLDGVEEWYKGLWKDSPVAASGRQQGGKNAMSAQECRVWFLATMMYRFGVRNGDVGRLTPKNFVEHDGSTYLVYTPHKTAQSSGTNVNWPLHPDLWSRIQKVRDMLEIDDDQVFVRSARETSNAVNRMLRQFPELADKEKASYELRKMCVDHAYHEWGVEMAAAISGDDIKTLTYFYADTSHVKVSDGLISCQV